LTSYSVALFFSSAKFAVPTEGELIYHLDEVTMMTDFRAAKILSHQGNIKRYARLLATELTELERQYLHKRIAEEQAELERLRTSPPGQAEPVIAAEAVGASKVERLNL
jgi:hypothetical protein